MTDLTKGEVSAVAQKAGCAWLHEPLAQRFATLCRADLVPVVEQLVQALCELVQSDGLPRTLEQLDASVKKAFAAIAAGQTFIKESKHA